MRARSQGFTLVELSIVLVILGLLVGGIMGGKSLIHAANLRSITAQRDEYQTAMHVFEEQYAALPGDLPNAYSYWSGKGVAGCQTNDTNLNTGCNGNGDGKVAGDGAMYGIPEEGKFWMHLSLAGLIEGGYPGGDVADRYGIATPKAKYETNNVWLALSLYQGLWGDYGAPLPNDPGGLYLVLGQTFFDVYMRGSSITNLDAWDIDTKVDDGKAFTGNMTAEWGDGTNGSDPYSMIRLGTNANCLNTQCYIYFKIHK